MGLLRTPMPPMGAPAMDWYPVLIPGDPPGLIVAGGLAPRALQPEKTSFKRA